MKVSEEVEITFFFRDFVREVTRCYSGHPLILKKRKLYEESNKDENLTVSH